MPASEIIGILETAWGCVVNQVIQKLRGEE